MRVRAAVLVESGREHPYAQSRPIEIREVDLAPPGQGELLVKIHAAGLCHSDLSVIDGSRPRPLPMVLGHEAAGEVVGLGLAADRFEVGDHVALAFVPACGNCLPCNSGRPALCINGAASNKAGTLLSGDRRWSDDQGKPINHHLGVSAFAEHAVVSARSAVKINPDLPFDLAALFGCAVLTGVGAAVNSAQVKAGDRVVVVGLGGVGLSAVLGARLSGAAQIVAVDVLQEKLDIARDAGATDCVLVGDGAAEQIIALTDGGGESVIETVGRGSALELAYGVTRAGGTTVTVGLPDPSDNISIPAVSLVTEERTLKGSYLGSCVPNRDINRFIDLYLRGLLPVDKLLSHRISLDEINEGFDRLARGEAVRQVVVF